MNPKDSYVRLYKYVLILNNNELKHVLLSILFNFQYMNYKDVNPISLHLISKFVLILDEDLGTIKALCTFINPNNQYHIIELMTI